MSELSKRVTRKFTQSYAVSDWDVETDTGWHPITAIHETIPYRRWIVRTVSGKILECADTHIVFLSTGEQVYVCDLQSGHSYIQTCDGPEQVVRVDISSETVPMYDLTVDSPDHRFYTNGILSHNTTILDALCFGLYGKPFRNIVKAGLINSINEKEMLVEISFSTQNNQYVIRRGAKPTVFTIECNGRMIPELPSVQEMQEYLEKYVLKCNYKAFTQVVILGSSSYVPFMRLTPAARREILEDVLDIEIFSSMFGLAKDRLSAAKDQVAHAQSTVTLVESQHAMAKTYADQWEQQQVQKRTALDVEIAQLNAKIATTQSQRDNLITETRQIQPTLDTLVPLREKQTKATKLVSKFNTALQQLQQTQQFFDEHSSCPTCTQVIDETFRGEKTTALHTQVADLNAKLQETQAIASRLERKIARVMEIQQEWHQMERARVQLEERIRSSQRDVRRLQEARANTFAAPPEPPSQLESLEEAQSRLAQVKYERYVAEQCHALLKDNGIRTKIIQHYLPTINRCVNQYLAALEFPIQFTLDDQFNETIKSRFRDDFSYENFSEGEKKRIDLALVLTWRAIARLKNSVSTNLLLFDEVLDSSLDFNGIDNFVSVIQTMDTDANVFIISHKETMQDKFSRTLTVSKNKGFSVVHES